jgi:hypothetical protein
MLSFISPAHEFVVQQRAESSCEGQVVVVEGVSPSCCVGRRVQGPPPGKFENKDAKSCILAVVQCNIDTSKFYVQWHFVWYSEFQ